MSLAKQAQFQVRRHVWLIALLGVIIPRRIRADWKQEWFAELRYRELLLADWDKLKWRNKLDLFRRSLGAFIDALWIQKLRLEDDMFQDLRYGARMLLKNPAFTLVALLSLALGIGANTSIFSLLDTVLLRSLPVYQPDRLLLFGPGNQAGVSVGFPNGSTELFSCKFYREFRQRSQSFSDITAIHSFSNRVHGIINDEGSANEPEQINAQLVSGSFFSVLGVNATAGRTITDDDDSTPGGHPVAVASYSWWAKRFGKDPSTVGKTIAIGNATYTIIGVAAKEFFGTTVGESPDIWVPLTMEEQLPPGFKGLDDPLFQSLHLIGRLRDGVPEAQAVAEGNVVFKQILQENVGAGPPADRSADIKQALIEFSPAGRGISDLRFQFSLPLKILMVVVGVVLLIACANLANLLLARGTGRKQEFAVRVALGANRGRIIRQLLTESVLLAVVGGMVGVVLGAWGSKLLVLMISTGPQPLPLAVDLDSRVLAFTLVISLTSALVFGSMPAFRASGFELNTLLKERRGSASSLTRSMLGKALLISQVALSLMLLFGAGLFIRTLMNIRSVDTGFGRDNVLLFQVDPNASGFDEEDPKLVRMYGEVERRVKELPGVRGASFSLWSFNQGGWTMRARPVGAPNSDEESRTVFNNAVGNDYFTAMQIPLLDGRSFGPQDTQNSHKVAVINQTMARNFFPDSSPIGRRFRWGRAEAQNVSPSGKPNPEIEVVGVVKDAKYGDLSEDPEPMAYYPYSQSPGYFSNFEVSFSGQGGPLIGEVRRIIKEVNRHVPVIEATSMAEQVDRSLVQQKLIAKLSAFFGMLALLLASIGLFGVMSYAVAKRTNEIGVRMALGAKRGDVLIMVMREAMMPVLIGIAIGLPAALALARLATSLLFGLTANDPATIAAATLVLIGVAAVAGYLPARRASRLDPLAALRYE